MKFKLFITFAFSSLTFLSCKAQTLSPNDFTKVPLPLIGSKELYALNDRGGQEFSVSLINGELHIEKEVYQSNTSFETPYGKLIGINHGEFGGGLYYKPNDTTIKHININGKRQRKRKNENPFSGSIVTPTNPITNLLKGTFLVKSGNIKRIFTYKDNIYTMEGLAHLSLNFGEFDQINVWGDSIVSSSVLDFDNSPEAFDIYDDAIYLATSNNFYIVRNWKKELVFKKLFWGDLYPNSVAVKDNHHIYIGMRAGYAMIDADSKEITFYKYNGKQ